MLNILFRIMNAYKRIQFIGIENHHINLTNCVVVFFFSSLFDVAFHNSRAAQRMANNNAPVRTRVPDLPNAERGGFCGALQRIQPPMPAGMARRLANKENYGLGKVSVVSH